MILTELRFSRGFRREQSEPLTGHAEFDGYNGSKIDVILSEEQAKAILLICEESIRNAVEQGLHSMKTSLIEGVKQNIIEHKD